MLILAKGLGILIVVLGATVIVNPEIFMIIINFWRKGKNVYIIGALRLIFGAIFLKAAPDCRSPIVITALGVLMILGGITIFVLGPKKIEKIFVWWEKKPPMFLRLVGVAPLVIGTLILYSV